MRLSPFPQNQNANVLYKIQNVFQWALTQKKSQIVSNNLLNISCYIIQLDKLQMENCEQTLSNFVVSSFATAIKRHTKPNMWGRKFLYGETERKRDWQRGKLIERNWHRERERDTEKKFGGNPYKLQKYPLMKLRSDDENNGLNRIQWNRFTYYRLRLFCFRGGLNGRTRV